MKRLRLRRSETGMAGSSRSFRKSSSWNRKQEKCRSRLRKPGLRKLKLYRTLGPRLSSALPPNFIEFKTAQPEERSLQADFRKFRLLIRKRKN